MLNSSTTMPTLLAAGGSPWMIDASSLAYLLLVVVAVTLMIIVTRRRIIRSQNSANPPARELYAQLKNEDGAKRELEALMMELDELARQLMGRLDSRFAKLEATIKDADERIDRLNRMIRAQSGHTTLDVTIDEAGTAGIASIGKSETPAREPDDPHANIYRLADQGASPVEIATQVGRSTGEIELILSLRRVRAQASAVSRR